MMPSWTALTTEPNALGESPFWHPQEQRLYWVDLPAKRIHRTLPGSGVVERWDVPQEPGCMAPAASGGLVIAMRDGIYRARTFGGELALLVRAEHDPATTRFNDGKCDVLGRFWAGTIYEPRTAHAAKLYSLDCRAGRPAELREQAGDAITANGLAWSPDNQTLYWANTPDHVVHAWNWAAEANTLSGQRVFQQLPGKPMGWVSGQPGPATYGGRPDGAAVDVEGNYYSAMFEGGRICKFAPDGRLLAEYKTPAQCPTMPCFGGADLRTLFVTTASQGRPPTELTAWPQSGCVFSLDVDVPGLPVNFFQE